MTIAISPLLDPPPRLRRRARGPWWLLAAGVLIGPAGSAQARPLAPSLLCQAVPDAAECSGQVASCSTCHTATWPPTWNDYGLQLIGAFSSGEYAEAMTEALRATQMLDADGDGITNLDELRVGTNPGDPDDASQWLGDGAGYCVVPSPDDERVAEAASILPVVEGYDFERAYRRVHALYCGRSPSYDELQDWRADDSDPAIRYQALHEALSACLASEYWRDEGLPRLADPLIRPVSSIGRDTAVNVTVGDYQWDYQLFSYVMSGGRDIRDLLLADYHVKREPDGSLVRVEGLIPSDLTNPAGRPVGGQPLEPAHRAGMITTQWFLAANTMFADLPRGTASQAYRAYLGLDIARLQGIVPVPDEPRDVDRRGVAEPQCAVCHSTLDPLTYAFAYYEGFPLDPTNPAISGTYDDSRPSRRVVDWQGDEQTWLLGQPVDSVVEWAQLAAQSDEFRRNMALRLFGHAFDREPSLAERPAFDRAWRGWPDDGWSADALIHRLVDFSTFGGLQ